MRKATVYHHFKKELILDDDRVSKCERLVVDLLFESSLKDAERESSICWELKHQASVRQFASMLALKRKLNVDICVVGAVFHDIYSLVSGKYACHAQKSAEMTEIFIKEIGGFSVDELNKIYQMIHNHSDKHIFTDNPYIEIGKDIDVIDCFLYEGAFDFYILNKSLSVLKGYVERAKMLWKEIGLPNDQRFYLLDTYTENWMGSFVVLKKKDALWLLDKMLSENSEITLVPPFFLSIKNNEIFLYYNKHDFLAFFYRYAKQKNGIDFELLNFLHNAILNCDLGDSCSELKIAGCDKKSLLLSRKGSYLFEEVNDCNGSVKGVLFWPILGLFQILSEKNDIYKLKELGVIS